MVIRKLSAPEKADRFLADRMASSCAVSTRGRFWPSTLAENPMPMNWLFEPAEAARSPGDPSIPRSRPSYRTLIAHPSDLCPTTRTTSPRETRPSPRGTAFQPNSGPGTRRSADMRMRPMAGIGLAPLREPVC